MSRSLLICAGLVIAIGGGHGAVSEAVTRQQFLDRLEQTHPLFDKEKLTAQIEQQERKSYLGDEEWMVSSSLFFVHDEPAIAFAAPEKTEAIAVAAGLDRLFWSTGGRLSATFSSTHASLTVDPFLGVPDSYFENKLAVTYSHPLGRNRHGLLDRLQFDLKQFDIDFSKVAAAEHEENFLAGSAATFLDWVLLTEQQRIVVERLHLSEEELARTREKRAANLVDEVDVIRAEDAVRIARQNLLLIESRSLAVQAEIAVLAQDTSYLAATPEYDLYRQESLPGFDEAKAKLKAESRLLQTIRIRLNQLQTARTGYEEMSKSQLSLIAQVGLKNAEPSWGTSLAMDKPEARLGLQFGFPVGNKTAKAKVAGSDLRTRQLEKQLEELTLKLSSAVAAVLTQAERLETVLELNVEQIDSARRKTSEELRLYDQGRGELTFVIASRDSEQAAKLTYAVNALTYHKLILQYQELTDQLHR